MQGIVMQGISKEFDGKWALRDISLSVEKGTIHAIIGENGAGKSTLMNILSGALTPNQGMITYDGTKVCFKNPQDASRLGIGIVHQHFMLIPMLKVWQNAILGIEPIRKNGSIDKNAAIYMLQKACADYSISLNLEQVVGTLTVGEQQRVEILKVMIRKADFIIFDEPTSVLTPQEIENLLTNIKNLKRMGKTILFISHKLEEVLGIADRITVLRQGRLIGTLDCGEACADKLVSMMVGREVNTDGMPLPVEQGEELLRVDGLCTERTRFSSGLDYVSFALREGEVLGVAGVDGNGQTELVEALLGLRKTTGGSVKKSGRELINLSSARIRKTGIAVIPPDRQTQGLVLSNPIQSNFIMGCEDSPRLGRRGTLKKKSVAAETQELAKTYDVRMPSLAALASELSGGNQQKVILAREFGLRSSDLVIAMNPTRGLDVGAIEFVYEQIERQKSRNKAILLISTELSEVLRLSDRIAVLFQGRLMGIVERKEATVEQLGRLMAGISAGKDGNRNEEA